MTAVVRVVIVPVLINSAVAAFLFLIGIGPDFGHVMFYSQCIGLSSYAASALALRLAPPGRTRRLALAAAVPAGTAFGVMLALTLVPPGDPQAAMRWGARSAVIGLLFGSALTYLFYSQARLRALEAEVREREWREAVAEKARIEAQLRELQAQIEPHFLFNTLANLSALIRADPPAAERMLADFIRYLRATLTRTREGGTLGDEMELLRAYLQILGIRMGDRLSFAFHVPSDLLARPFPPMLLQPLLENAVRHGLEPKVGGGGVHIHASGNGQSLRIEIEDSGIGLATAHPVFGTGLDNVARRLRSLYGDAGRLSVCRNEKGGVTATLEVPA